MFDIHSHILPQIDDGAADMKEAVELLKIMKKSGITSVIATPHFYPDLISLEDFSEITGNAYRDLLAETANKKLPKVYLGCELLYYKGVGNSDALPQMTLNGSKYLLLELAVGDIDKDLFQDLLLLKEQGITPIIAHVERYFSDRSFKKLLTFLKENDIPVQLNAVSFLIRPLKRIIKMIFKSELFCVVGTDAHSICERPPFMKEAFEAIRDTYGKEMRHRLIKNANLLYNEITGDTIEK